MDVFRGPWGPGRPGTPTCVGREAEGECSQVVDLGNGTYRLSLLTPPDVATARIVTFGATFDVPVPCDVCPKLNLFAINPNAVAEHGTTTGQVQLNGPAPQGGMGGAVVYLTSDKPLVAAVPTFVIVPQNQFVVDFPITAGHVGDDLTDPNSDEVVISATYGADTIDATLKVTRAPTDFDQDGLDDSVDNCVCVANPTQCDTDGDRIGNNCDADLNNDGVTGIPDFNILRQAFGSRQGDGNFNPNADLDCNGAVGISDFNSFRSLFERAASRMALCPQPLAGEQHEHE